MGRRFFHRCHMKKAILITNTEILGRKKLEVHPLNELEQMVKAGTAERKNTLLFKALEPTEKTDINPQAYNTRMMQAETPTKGRKRGRPRKNDNQ